VFLGVAQDVMKRIKTGQQKNKKTDLKFLHLNARTALKIG
jgi:hypothetical protein